jgi:hypothetical protein
MLQYLVGCSAQKITDEQTRNLQKLSRVWGFATFTHQSFLLGLADWDEELLELIPVVLSAREDEVNDILYKWFIGLGDDGYDLDWEAYRAALLAYYEEAKVSIHNFLIEYADGLDSYVDDLFQSQIQVIDDSINFISEHGEISDWEAMKMFTEDLFRLRGNEMNLRPMADTSWINESYLGSSFYAVLSRFHQIQIVDLTNAPVNFDIIFTGKSTFANLNDFPDMDFSDDWYRLLGLFRLWNAMEYYFPYMDIIDDCWHELLLDFIPEMTEGTDKLSYELTLAALTSNLHDAHITYWGQYGFLDEKFGSFRRLFR